MIKEVGKKREKREKKERGRELDVCSFGGGADNATVSDSIASRRALVRFTLSYRKPQQPLKPLSVAALCS